MGTVKVFGIGRNKTGTSSLKWALRELGYIVGHQPMAEWLLTSWAIRDFGPIIEYCHSADAFQDIPFSLDYTFQALDMAFPGSKFILTVRDGAEQWWQSLVRWISRVRGRLPTALELAADGYRYKGWMLQTVEFIYNHPAVPLWDKKAYKQVYRAHNRQVRQYFRHRPGDLLVLNVAHESAYRDLCRFLGRAQPGTPFPWRNRSKL